MNCREFGEKVSLYLDDRLSSREAQVLEQHVRSCETCRARLELLEQIPVALKTDQMLAPKSDFTHQVMRQVVVSQQFRLVEQKKSPKIISLEEQRRKRSGKSPTLYLLQLTAVAAVLFFVVGAGVYMQALPTNISGGQASSNIPIAWVAELITSSFQQPLVLIIGIVLALAISVAGWFYLTRSKRAG